MAKQAHAEGWKPQNALVSGLCALKTCQEPLTGRRRRCLLTLVQTLCSDQMALSLWQGNR